QICHNNGSNHGWFCDELYRTDLPSLSHHNNYYSSSSVYSYSPTSTSDCPEHGRSRRKITVILTVSIVLATIGVLSIAGVAAYLGILSKNVSSNTSQYEESSYLLANKKLHNRNDYIITNGRSRYDGANPDNHLDITNSIVDTKLTHEDHSSIPHEDDLTRHIFPSNTRYSQKNSTSEVKTTSSSNTKGPDLEVSRPSTRPSARPTIFTASTPISITYATNSRFDDAPVIIRAPPTEPPKFNSHDRYLRNRHRNRHPLTNSHALPPSSTSTQQSVSKLETRAGDDSETMSPRDEAESSHDNISGDLDKGQDSADDTTEMTHSQGASAEAEDIRNNRNPEEPLLGHRRKEGLAGGHRIISSSSEKNLKAQHRDTMVHDHSQFTPSESSIDRNFDEDRLKNHRVISTTTEEQQSEHPDYFIPVKPLFTDSPPQTVNSGNDKSRIENSKPHLTFDRISPEFYDRKPWIPLLNRPNLDKRPRVELNTPSSEMPSHEVEETTEMYERIDHDRTGDVSSNEPVRHASPSSIDRMDEGSITTLESSSMSSSKDPTDDEDGMKPPDIPAFTIYIPHIPAPSTDTLDSAHLQGTNRERDDLNLNFTAPSDTSSQSDNNSSHRTYPNSASNDSSVGDDHEADNGDEYGDEDKLKRVFLTSSEEGSAKDEDYLESEDEVTGDGSPQTNIYKLDPDTVDIVPDTLATARPPPIRDLRKEESEDPPEPNPVDSGEHFEKVPTISNDSREQPSMQSNSTSDAIITTLGSLHLMKASDTYETSSDLGDSSSDDYVSQDKNTESPLFPPVRSYVSVNLPLRPKPTGEDDDIDRPKSFGMNDNSFEGVLKNVRVFTDDDGQLPDLTLSTASSLNKVLSMMMNQKDKIPLDVGHRNVHLVVSDNGQAIIVKNNTSNITSHREAKVFNSRDPKIDTRFNDHVDSVEHVPVPLIQPVVGGSTNKTKVSAVTFSNNSPVYKFVLKKGQSVEELLKEIFQNYTDKDKPEVVEDETTTTAENFSEFTTDRDVGSTSTGINSIQVETSFIPTSIQTKPVTPPFLLKHELHSAIFSTAATGTTLDPHVKTSTSVIVNGDLEPCPTNSSFRCASNGKCISGFGRCNGMRDCPDNSDEKGCLCVDLLRAQMLHRKICDGVPDCKDFSDEYQCDWCSPGQYICAGSRACVNRDKICDGRRDCPRGDDENECVKIGSSDSRDELEDFSPTYHRSGHLMVRKKGVWGKLCVETFSTVVSHWEVKDLARAVCKALTFSDFETVERVEDEETKPSTVPYYELYFGSNETESGENSSGFASSSESSPRTSLGFKQTQCKSRQVVRVTCQDLQCGIAPRAFTQAARIVGGANALPGEWPWQAALYRDGEYQCGATLISSRWLLSAGHCFYHAQDDYWVARLGTLRRGATVLSPYEQVVRITHIFLHPQYKDVGFINDVSLLRLEHEVNFTDFVRPVCLPGRDTKIRDGRMCTVVGWGQLFEVGRVFPDTLQEVQLPLISTGECRKRTLFLPLYKLTDEMFCAGFDRGGRDACLGDSGGPLMCSETDGRWSLYGVTSNGYGCARANRPGVYTKVASYLDWIYDKMSQGNALTYRDKAKPCTGHRCPLGECLEKRRLCNGVSDCLDGSDEKNCTWS
ncbi:unnamed protein product, partial [Allacma fusca]